MKLPKIMFLLVVFFLASTFSINASYQQTQPSKETSEETTKALFEAVNKADIDTLQTLLSSGANANTKNKENYSLLMAACCNYYQESNGLKLVKTLITNGAKINEPLLMCPVYRGDINLVKFLISNGVDVNLQNDYGSTALMSASQTGYIEIVRLLLAAGSDVNKRDNKGYSALRIAVLHNSLNVFKLLIQAKADIEADKNSILIDSCRGNYTEIVKLMLEAKANVNTTNEYGASPLMYAACFPTTEVLEKLIISGANINGKDNKGRTALMYAVERGAIESVKVLLQAKADPKVKDQNGQTAFYIASSGGKVEIANLLKTAANFEQEQSLEEHSKSDIEKLKTYLINGESNKISDLGAKHRNDTTQYRNLWQQALYFPEPTAQSSTKAYILYRRAQLAFVADMIDLAFNSYQEIFTNYPEAFYEYAEQAAKVAIYKKDYTTALLFLKKGISHTTFVPNKTPGIVLDPLQPRIDSLNKLIAQITDIQTRIEFAKEFWSTNSFHRYDKAAINLLEESLSLKPTKEQTAEIYSLLQLAYLDIEDVNNAEIYITKMIQEFPEKEVTDAAVFSLSQKYFEKNDFPKAKEILLTIINKNNQNRWISMAYLGLAETYEKIGDKESMLKYLKAVTELPKPTPTSRSIMDTSDTLQVALIRLGDYYKSIGNNAEALKYYQTWTPHSWCGTCSRINRASKDLLIAECLTRLGKKEEAYKNHLLPHIADFGGDVSDMFKISTLTVSIAEDLNKLETLLAEAKSHTSGEYTEYKGIAQQIEILANIRLMAKNQDIKGLILEFKQSKVEEVDVVDIKDSLYRERNWRSLAAAKALSDIGGKEFLVLQNNLEDLLTKKEFQNIDYACVSWVIYTLGLSKSPESKPYLQELIKKVNLEKYNRLSLYELNFALTLK